MLRHLLTRTASISTRSLFGKTRANSGFTSSDITLADGRTDSHRTKIPWMVAAGAGLASALWLNVYCLDGKTSDRPSEPFTAPNPQSSSCPAPSSIEANPQMEEYGPAVHVNDVIILLTNNLPVFNPDNGDCVDATILFDNGTLVSLIHEDLAQSLKLEPIGQYRYTYEGFNNNTGSFISTMYIVQLKKTTGEMVDLVVHSIPSMDIAMSAVATGDQNELNPTRRIVTPCITIGSDRFWDFVHCRGDPLPSGLWSIHTVFGRMATGPIRASMCPIHSQHPHPSFFPPQMNNLN